MILDRTVLESACRTVAKNCMWQRQPVDQSSVDALGRRFADIAQNYAEYLSLQDQDPNIVIRTVRYIDPHHGEPHGDRTDWFHEALDVLVELVCPNTAPNDDSERFYKDVEFGIAVTRRDSPPG